jgi:hypothetical protein
MFRRHLLACALFACLVPAAPAEEKEGFTKLFNGTDLTGWKTYLDPRKNADPAKIWTITDGVINCEGSVNGYLITEKDYSDYVLRLKWRWGKRLGKNPNSGVFVHVSGPDKIWPKGLEAQLASGQAGDIWLVGEFAAKIDPDRQDKRTPRHYFRTVREGVEKPLGEWNQYEITCKGNAVKLVVNGQELNTATDCEASTGKILLQSEGSEIEFKDIEIKSLK